MIDLKQLRPSQNGYIDGELEDGRLVKLKTIIPTNYDNVIRQVVAIANTVGGMIIFGIDGKTKSVVGIHDYRQLICDLELAIRNLSLGISHSITHEVVYDKDVIVLRIKKAEVTTYFSRVTTTPARQIAYKYIEDVDGKVSLSREEKRYTKVFKYMTLEAFITSIYSGCWRFFEPSKWKDKFEQRFYCANYTLPASIDNTPQLFATCVTRVKNSEAAWKVYSNGQGLGTHCLQLELDIVELRKQIRASGFRFEEKLIKYERENVIMGLHKKKSLYYKKYFSSFTLDSFLNLLSLKRDAYTYEQELRLFIIPVNGEGRRNKYKKAQYQDVMINWSKVISRVRIDKKCSDAELVSIQRACISAGINPVIKNYTFIGNVGRKADTKDVDFERFDIDDMPGTSGITIS